MEHRYRHKEGHLLLVSSALREEAADKVTEGGVRGYAPGYDPVLVAHPEDWKEERGQGAQWMRHIIPTMSQLAGGRRRTDFERAIEERLDPQDLEAFYRWLQQVEQELMSAKRTHRMFPGGPSIRL
jgi:hypothetical protein